MIKRLGSADRKRTLGEIFPKANWPFFGLEIYPLKETHSDEQRKGFHKLLRDYHNALVETGRYNDTYETLKSDLLIVQWGCFKATDQYGNEQLCPVKRTTVSWSWDKGAYIRDECTREQYSELIDLVYRMASEDGITLPELEKC